MCDLPEGMHGLLCALSCCLWPPGARGARHCVCASPRQLGPHLPASRAAIPLPPHAQAVTGMVYSNANPSWPSNGNGNAFVLPVRRSKRQTDLVITVWDGSESLEEAIPVGKVHVNLQEYMQFPVLPPGKDTPDDAPPSEFLQLPTLSRSRNVTTCFARVCAAGYAFEVDLVPRLSAISRTPARLTGLCPRTFFFHPRSR